MANWPLLGCVWGDSAFMFMRLCVLQRGHLRGADYGAQWGQMGAFEGDCIVGKINYLNNSKHLAP